MDTAFSATLGRPHTPHPESSTQKRSLIGRGANSRIQPFHYVLRKTLPPWAFDRKLQELLDHVTEHTIDEVMVIVDTEEFSRGHPPLEWVSSYVPRLVECRDRLADIGVAYSLDSYFSVGHNDRGRDSSKAILGFRGMVGADGTLAHATSCPLSAAWRDYLAELMKLYASTHPNVLWINDDFRTFNHEPVKYGCFCEEHLKRYAEAANLQAISREELVRQIVLPGDPHAARKNYLQIHRETLVELAGLIRTAVWRTSPETHLGLMSSGPRAHVCEWRDWESVAHAFAPDRPLYSRPPLGTYWEGNLRGIIFTQDSIKLTRHVLPRGTVEQTEVENYPMTRYAKSALMTQLQILASAAYGAHGATLDIYDHCGNPIADEPSYGPALAAIKPWAAALQSHVPESGCLRGVRMLFHSDYALHKRTRIGEYPEMCASDYPVVELFESLGVPTTYSEDGVTAAIGDAIRCLTDNEISQLLEGGLFLDAVAARALFERGFGDKIGLSSIGTPCLMDDLGAFAAEEILHESFGGHPQSYLTSNCYELAVRPWISGMQLLESATLISRFVDYDTHPLLPAMSAFENAIGGRVIIHAIDYSGVGVSSLHPRRKKQLEGAVQWLGKGSVPILVSASGVYSMGLRWDGLGGVMLFGVFNLSMDPWEWAEIRLDVPLQAEQILEILPDGSIGLPSDLRVTTTPTATSIRVQRKISSDRPLFFHVKAG